MTDLSIIIPCYNEFGNIEPLVNDLDQHLGASSIVWEVIFVDDNSPDGTADRVRDLSEVRPQIRCIQRQTDRGLASAVLWGFQAAHGKVFIVMDADLQHDAAIIPEMYKSIIQGNDICIGSRFSTYASRDKLDGLSSGWRNRLSQAGNRVLNFFLGQRLSDPLSGFFAIRRDLISASIEKLSAYGFKILFDILYYNKGCRVSEIHFTFGKRLSGESKLEPVVFWHLFCDLLSKLTASVIPARFISFLAVGFIGIFIHFSVLFVLLFIGLEFWFCQLTATLVAMTSNFIINNVLTYSERRLSGVHFISGLLIYAMASAIGIVANVGVASYMFTAKGSTPVVSGLAGVLIDTIWRFAVANRIIWKKISS